MFLLAFITHVSSYHIDDRPKVYMGSYRFNKEIINTPEVER